MAASSLTASASASTGASAHGDNVSSAPHLAPWKNAVAGATAGVVSRFVIAPLDVVKIRFQMQTDVRGTVGRVDPAGAKYTGVVQACTRIMREEGYRGLWKGNLSAEYLYLTYGAVQFYSYAEFADLIARTDRISPFPLPSEMLAGALAGCAATVATYPFDLLRTRFAMQGASGGPYTSLLSAVAQIHKDEGIRGFYRGVAPSVLQMAPQMGIVFASYAGLKRALQNVDLAGAESFFSGGAAGMLGKLSLMPFDVVRKRLQVQGPERNSYVTGKVPSYPSGLFRCGAQIVRQEGWLALYKGVVPALLKAGPSSAVTFAVVKAVTGLLE